MKMSRTQKKYPGGQWSAEKLDIFEKFLRSYAADAEAKKYRSVYADGFAGHGYMGPDEEDALRRPRLIADTGGPYLTLLTGSPRRALEATPGLFDRLLLVDSDQGNIDKLNGLSKQFRERCIQVQKGDANTVLPSWCKDQNTNLGVPWDGERAVILLDPFGTQVNWSTVEAIAATKSAHIWILFPLTAVSRMLPKEAMPKQGIGRSLDRIFGGQMWQKLYRTELVGSRLVQSEVSHSKDVRGGNCEIVEAYLDRLRSIFEHVSARPKWLYARGHPQFVFMFASAVSDKLGQCAAGIAQRSMT